MPALTLRHHAARRIGFSRLIAWLTLAAVFLSPFTTWRIVPGLLFTLSDGLFCLSLALLFASRQPGISAFADLTPLWLGALGVMMLGLLLGSVVNGDPARWLVVAAQYIFAYGLLPIVFGLSGRRDALHAAGALLAGVVAMELFGIVVYVAVGGDYDRAAVFGSEFITGTHRLGNFMADANWNGAISAMAIPFALFLSRIGRIGPAILLPVLAILGGGVVLSGSFTGFTAAAAGTFIFMLLGGSPRGLLALTALVTVAGMTLASGVALPTAFQHRVMNALENGNINQAGTYQGRMQLMTEAWEMVGHTPVIGIGVDQFRAASPIEAPVHNMYLLAWAEGGVLALVGWVTMTALPVVASLRAYPRDRYVAAFGLAVSAIFFIFSLAAPHMYARSWVVPLLIAMAMVFAPDRERSGAA